MTRSKLNVAIDDRLLTAVKVSAARSHRHDYEVVEDALRSHLALQDVVDRIWSGLGDNALDEEEAMAIANAEVAAVRAQRRASR